MKWDATLVTSFEGLSQYPKFLNSEGQWTKCSPAQTIRLNNHVVVDIADVRNFNSTGAEFIIRSEKYRFLECEKEILDELSLNGGIVKVLDLTKFCPMEMLKQYYQGLISLWLAHRPVLKVGKARVLPEYIF
uniref:Uncharacterized protein n=1 Tax=Magallana gigas TaxID=29159 RepID=K1RM54_MAGGI